MACFFQVTALGQPKLQPPRETSTDEDPWHQLNELLEDESDTTADKVENQATIKNDASKNKKKATPQKKARASTGQSGEDGRLGRAPEDRSQVFLRGSTVLLRPGEVQFDHGLTYRIEEFVSPIFLTDGSLVNERIRSRRSFVPFSLRFGIQERMQGFLSLPFGYSQVERSDIDSDDSTRTFGIGDLSAGVSRLLQPEQENRPDIIGTLSFSAPIGDDPFGVSPNDPALGNGFWSVSGRLNAIKSYDPVVVFGSVGYSHFFERQFFGSDIQLGERIEYACGMGMSINEDITLSASLVGSFQFRTRIDSVRIPGTSFEPVSVRMAITGTMFKRHIIEPFVDIGLTRDAANANFGMIVTKL